jgi:hypothetical protein
MAAAATATRYMLWGESVRSAVSLIRSAKSPIRFSRLLMPDIGRNKRYNQQHAGKLALERKHVKDSPI